MRLWVGRLMVASGIAMTLATLAAFAYGVVYPVEEWTGDDLFAFRYLQSASGLTCSAAGLMLVMIGAIVVRGVDEDPPDPAGGRQA